ncbi:hypothetical protein ASF49_08110 [Methylobacterium sp. Leaf104]|uniref:hypothetical protein n=1 Tax=Methylobacterium TaxID=407 RepID=UPI0006F71F04|nr:MULTISPECIES: hypothetical protein [Methylobacterium]KQP33821.1 hypothetical protein ASF49_08110 [Methylobacterium sp. Leaf104]MCI9879611.1 hypothetical protein [Methylobacterium goesingense]
MQTHIPAIIAIVAAAVPLAPVPGVAGDTVQEAIAELAGRPSGGSSEVDAAAVALAAVPGLDAETVQAAIESLSAKPVILDRQVTLTAPYAFTAPSAVTPTGSEQVDVVFELVFGPEDRMELTVPLSPGLDQQGIRDAFAAYLEPDVSVTLGNFGAGKLTLAGLLRLDFTRTSPAARVALGLDLDTATILEPVVEARLPLSTEDVAHGNDRLSAVLPVTESFVRGIGAPSRYYAPSADGEVTFLAGGVPVTVPLYVTDTTPDRVVDRLNTAVNAAGGSPFGEPTFALRDSHTLTSTGHASVKFTGSDTTYAAEVLGFDLGVTYGASRGTALSGTGVAVDGRGIDALLRNLAAEVAILRARVVALEGATE